MSEFLDIAIGQLMPILISWLKRCAWPDWAKVLLSLMACLVVRAAKSFLLGEFTLDTAVASTGIILASATVAYKTWFQSTPLNADLEDKSIL